MEFEKLQEIIQEVLNCDKDEITMDSKFIDDLGEIPTEVAEQIESVGDAVEQIKNAVN